MTPGVWCGPKLVRSLNELQRSQQLVTPHKSHIVIQKSHHNPVLVLKALVKSLVESLWDFMSHASGHPQDHSSSMGGHACRAGGKMQVLVATNCHLCYSALLVKIRSRLVAIYVFAACTPLFGSDTNSNDQEITETTKRLPRDHQETAKTPYTDLAGDNQLRALRPVRQQQRGWHQPWDPRR